MFRRAFLFILAALLFFVVISLLAVLSNIPTGKEKRALAEIRDAQNRLIRDYGIISVQSGYQRKVGGNGDVYVPLILVRVSNLSDATSRPVEIRAEFLRKERDFCEARGTVPELQPGEIWDMWLKCIEFVGFGSVAWGLPLAETTESMNFNVYLDSDRVSVLLIKDKLKSTFF